MNSEDDALLFVKNTILKEPFMIAGTDRVDSEIISLCGYIAKSGSEGIFCLSIPSDEIGIAIKIESGSDIAAECVAVEILDRMGLLNGEQKTALNKYRFLEILTSMNIRVGRYEPIF